MLEAVYRTLTLPCTLVGALPIGTNLGLLHLHDVVGMSP